MGQAALQQIIGAIGDPHFAATASRAVREFMGFEMAAMLLHRAHATAAVLFDDLGAAGFGPGLDNYVRVTHRINPILARGPAAGACRARDFRARQLDIRDDIRDHLVLTDEEELGFRTLGWPPRLEEVGLYFRTGGGTVELSLYRERGRNPATAGKMRALAALRIPLAAAFERHRALLPRQLPARSVGPLLSPREREVCDLMLAGCSSTAIALRLGITVHTVKDHRKQVFRKLGVASLAELFVLAGRSEAPPLEGWPTDRSVRIM